MAIGGKVNMDAVSAKVMNSRRVVLAMEKKVKQVFERNKNEVIKEFEAFLKTARTRSLQWPISMPGKNASNR